MFVDRVTLHLRGGDGGAGVVAFRRVRGRPKGKPEGGSGARGGDVWLLADPDVTTLLRYRTRSRYSAGTGGHGQGDLRHGHRGADLELGVPLGTIVRDPGGTMIADLVRAGQRVRVCRGGRGGRGNAAFTGPRRKAPGFAEQGEYGEQADVVLELKLLADAALIGFPNAGKSTLIASVSAARPKVADYPFTTLEPTLGVVAVDDVEFVLADIPGLVEGAAAGKGLGHEFLRHAERARVLVVLLDPTALQPVPPARQHDVLIGELAAHGEDLASRPRIVALNKTDAVTDVVDIAKWADAAALQLHHVSAATGAGVVELMRSVAAAVDVSARSLPERAGYVLHRPAAHGFTVTRKGLQWVVEGLAAQRAVALSDLTQPEAAALAARRLQRAGVEEALRRAGAQPGDEVCIGDLVFEFQEHQPTD